jgi:hypothetical protein
MLPTPKMHIVIKKEKYIIHGGLDCDAMCLVDGFQCFRGTYCLHLQGLQVYIVSQPRRPPSSQPRASQISDHYVIHITIIQGIN